MKQARRYRDYDVFRSRVRVIQENLFANALDPSEGVETHDWRTNLSKDYRRPTLNVSLYEALANRLRSVYCALLGVLLGAWVFRITAFAPHQDWVTTAGIARLPGVAVVAVVGVFYVVLLGITVWPHERHAKGEFHEVGPDDQVEPDR